MKVRKAVIVAAGLGTRMLPATRVIPKEILPVVDRPAIQVVVEEAIASGIEEIVVVVAPGRSLVLDHFAPVPDLERHLQERGKRDLLDLVRSIATMALITRAEQRQPLGLGHAVLQARAAIGDEPFAVILPDDIFDSEPPCLRQLLDVAEAREAPVVALMRVGPQDISKYGIVEASSAGERLHRLTGMVEKPEPSKAPSDFAIVGRYVLTPEIFGILAEVKPGAGGEIQLTDGLLALCRRRPMYGYKFSGTRYDLGDRLGLITAQIGFGLKRPDLADRLRAYLKTLISA
ncbi:MAG TPA: UTP--glucose-1-phosphate uridylyltransferase [Candidatus Binataceae bacterium]|jgi:UTP--glucose-1-phosphate uridylyltransferase|nr:UTP--glucose-1-phosphate uridylyltransferase [Candidatus Binataceae bacterium]